MPPLSFAFASVLFLAVSSLHAQPAAHSVSAQSWEPESGDRLVIDTRMNDGFLVHADGRYIRFPVITGQNRTVHYIGLRYDATTPVGSWEIRTRHVKGDRITYGPEGRFLRFYSDGEFTHYGVHEHAHEDRMFERDDRFQSMGCVIVRHAVMDILMETFETFGAINVVTQYGLDDPVTVAFQVPGNVAPQIVERN